MTALAPFLLVGFVALKAGVLLSGGYGIGKRSVDNLEDNEKINQQQNLFLSTVTHLDPNGCILKFLCNLETKPMETLTQEEAMLAHIFTQNDTNKDSLTPYSAAFVYAAEMGYQSKDAASCNKLFNQCTLDDQQLRSLFGRSWSCDQ
ncbi:hypothetical protein Pmani_002062 [Petrolisthes manimaculis]|uniref:Uncharacterized protein n=1 Tax=Petrolisthes manimaculis TaxID=1843537 RepID=A0AAE1UNR4_9EUCA|nr:hypothetical protein Pmani_002062 [Petrolisthes manimaculis]